MRVYRELCILHPKHWVSLWDIGGGFLANALDYFMPEA